jgi:CxxC motif-containing protein (DUF1111 family)
MKLRLFIISLSWWLGNLSFAQDNPFAISEAGLDYLTGQALFEKIWVSAPSSTRASDGLGPLYNARSCAECHVEAGKAKLPAGLTFRIDSDFLGQQIQSSAIAGLPAEAQVEISYTSVVETLSDSTEVILKKPHYVFNNIQTDSERSGSRQIEIEEFSPRFAPALFGIGLIADIPLHELIEKEDPEDLNNDGISGRAGPGRFGWKADVINLEQQTGKALSLDIGISSELFPNPFGDCTQLQDYCLSRPNGASRQDRNLEIGPPAFASLLYIPLPVVNVDNMNMPGEVIFENIGCQSCHQTGYMQGAINPYSDLLLHDMGDALADTFNDELSREWRTPPLWGLSSYQQNDEQYYLHDGRATNLLEAILWHGGEAEGPKQAFKSLSTTARQDLINFLRSR